MSSLSANNLTREKIQQLLAVVGSQKAQPEDQIEAAEYNWNEPHYFGSEQMEKLGEFAGNIASELSRKFTHLYQTNFDVTVSSITEHYAAEFIDQNPDNKQQDYCLVLKDNQNVPCGLIGIPPKTALIWLTLLLGDSESESDPAKDLSQLERSLLLDISYCLSKAIFSCHESFEFRTADNISTGQFPLEFSGSEELCKINFSFAKNDSDYSGEAYLLIACEKLRQVTGKSQLDKENPAAEDIKKAILEHLNEISVSVTARLASSELTLEQIMTLQQDDILLLNKKVGKPVELIVEGRTLFLGQPAKSAGNHAVVITQADSKT